MGLLCSARARNGLARHAERGGRDEDEEGLVDLCTCSKLASKLVLELRRGRSLFVSPFLAFLFTSLSAGLVLLYSAAHIFRRDVHQQKTLHEIHKRTDFQRNNEWLREYRLTEIRED